MSVGNVLTVLGVMSFIIALKVMICSCYIRHRQRRAREDTRPILEEDDRLERLFETHHARMRARRAREPPPTFEDALRHSRPVSHIDVEEPPPTYEEYLNSPSQKESYLDYSPSINPTDAIIPMEVDTGSLISLNNFGVESIA